MSKLLSLLGKGVTLKAGEGYLEGKDLLIKSNCIRIYDPRKEKIIFTIEKDENLKLYNSLKTI